MPQCPRMARASAGASGGKAAEVVAPLARGLCAEGALGFDDGDTAQCGPLPTHAQPVELAGAEVAPRFNPPVVFFHGLMPAGCGQVGGMIQRVIEEGLDLLVQDFVVGFEREHIVCVSLVDFARDGFLAAHRVEGHDAAGQFQPPPQLGHGGDLPAPSGAALRAKAPPFGYLAPLGSASASLRACSLRMPFSRAEG